MSTQSDSSDSVSSLNSISNTLSFYMLLIIFVVGVPGNLLSLFIYTRPSLNRKTNTGFLYTWLCFLNLIAIFQNIFLVRPQNLFGYSAPRSPCGLFDFIRRVCYNSVSWMQVFISFDRFIHVVLPGKAYLMKKKVQTIFLQSYHI